MKSTLSVLVLAALVAGCGARGPVATTNPYYGPDYDYHRGQGPNTVTGQAFLRQKGGGLVTCAGTTAAIFPATPYFREVLAIYRSGRTVQQPTPAGASGNPVRSAVCDAQGNFSISSVPSGRWILVSEVAWMAGYERQGGSLSREVDVVDGGTNRFILSDADRQ